MNNPEELLRKARYLWYSEKNAFRAQQILNEIIKDYPDSQEAVRAKGLRDLIATSPAPGVPNSEAEESREAWRHTVQKNALRIIVFLPVMFISWRLKESPLLVIAMMTAASMVIIVFVPDSILEKFLQFWSRLR
mgnify:CR=1 FL=1